MPTPTSEPIPRPWSAVALAVIGPLVVWVVGVLLGAAVSTDTLPAGQCEGIGWGCTLTPRDSMLFLGLIGGVVVVPIAIAIAAVVAFVSPRPAAQRNIGVLLATYAGAMLVLSLLVVTSI